MRDTSEVMDDNPIGALVGKVIDVLAWPFVLLGRIFNRGGS